MNSQTQQAQGCHAPAGPLEEGTENVLDPSRSQSDIVPPPVREQDEALDAAALATPGASLDSFAALTGKISGLHPSKYGELVDGISTVHLQQVTPLADQSSALRWVVLIDRIYDRSIPVRASGAPLDQIFTPEMLRGGYRKKYLRATSRILALARDAGWNGPRSPVAPFLRQRRIPCRPHIRADQRRPRG